MLMLVLLLTAQDATPTDAATEATRDARRQSAWVGCLQAGSTPDTYRLNLNEGATTPGTSAAGSLGRPFLQLLPTTSKVQLAAYVGKRVRVRGRQLAPEEAEREAVERPDKQEAAETAAGTGGATQRHLAYVRVDTVSVVQGSCPAD